MPSDLQSKNTSQGEKKHSQKDNKIGIQNIIDRSERLLKEIHVEISLDKAEKRRCIHVANNKKFKVEASFRRHSSKMYGEESLRITE